MTKETETFVWDPYGNQTYSSEYGSQQLTGEYFSKAPNTSFTMNAPGQILTLCPTASSLWGTTHDVTLPPVKVALEQGSLLIMPGDSADPVNFTLGPFLNKHTPGTPTVAISITEGDFALIGFQTVRAGGIGRNPQINLKLDLLKTGKYTVDCETYHSAKMLSISHSSSAKICAKEIILKYGIYEVERTLTDKPPSEKHIPLYVECTGGDMHIQQLTVSCRNTGTALFKGGHASFYGTNRFSAAADSAVTIACDKISFKKEADPVLQFEPGAGEIFFDTYSGQPPFDFLENSYPTGFFNFVTKTGKNKTKIRIVGIGNAFQRYQMEKMEVVSIDGVPQRSWKNVIDHQYGKDLVFWLKNQETLTGGPHE